MRDGILDQLPKALPKDKLVIVAGPPDAPGQNDLRTLINELNRGDKWIRDVFSSQTSEAQIPNKAGIVLTMVGLKHGPLTNVRRAAGTLGICCPNQALTIGETKEILRNLSQVRRSVLVLPGDHNGNGSHPLPGKGEVQRLDDLAKVAQQTGETFSGVLRQPTAESETVESEAGVVPPQEIVDDSDEVVAALAAIERFRDVSNETEVAVLMVSDRLKAVTAERDDLQRKLMATDRVIADLHGQSATIDQLIKENGALLEKNRGLEAEIRKLRTTLDQFDNLIKGVRK
jgi:hypothetical protein